MSRLARIGGHTPGTASARTRMKSGDPGGTPDALFSGPAPLLTLEDVAMRLQVSVRTTRGWVDAGKLRVVRLPGRLVRVDPVELARFRAEECR